MLAYTLGFLVNVTGFILIRLMVRVTVKLFPKSMFWVMAHFFVSQDNYLRSSCLLSFYMAFGTGWLYLFSNPMLGGLSTAQYVIHYIQLAPGIVLTTLAKIVAPHMVGSLIGVGFQIYLEQKRLNKLVKQINQS